LSLSHSGTGGLETWISYIRSSFPVALRQSTISFCCWALLRNNNMAPNLQRFASSYGNIVGVLQHVTVELRHLGR